MTPSFTDLATALCGHDAIGLDVDAVRAALPAVLRRSVPSTLIELWTQVGGEDELLSCFHRFRAPAELELHEGHVIFLEENQSVVLWGFRPGHDDPEVVQFVVTEEGLDGPFPEGASLDAFLRAILIMQAAQAHEFMPHVGYVERERGTGALLIAAGLTAAPSVGSLSTFFATGTAATVVSDDDGETIIVATRSDAELDRFADVLSIDRDTFEL